MMGTELLTAAQVADLAQVSPRTVARWAEAGLLPYAMKLPGLRGAFLFAASEVEAFLAPEPAA